MLGIMTARFPRGLAALMVAGALSGCGGGSATRPDPVPGVKIATGLQILRITPQFRCPAVGPAAPFVSTRVVVNRSGSDWIANADSAAGGDVRLTFRPDSSTSVLPGVMKVTGTITGTAVHMPELLPTLPAWAVRARFGTNGQTVLDGVAFEAGALPSTTGGLDGVGQGVITLVDAGGASCNGSSFSWAVFPPDAR